MFQTISMKEFQQCCEGTINIIDVRGQAMYEEGHVAHAVNMPFSELETTCSMLDPGTTYHVICQRGSTSQRACTLLAQKGFDVINVEGGMSQWTGDVECGC